MKTEKTTTLKLSMLMTYSLVKMRRKRLMTTITPTTMTPTTMSGNIVSNPLKKRILEESGGGSEEKDTEGRKRISEVSQMG